MAAQIQFRDVTLGYDRHPAVHHLNGEVPSGALLAIVGPNGAGKSTLFRGLVGILKPLAGSIATDGLDVRDIAYLPQTADIDRSFPISVFDLVGTGLWRATGFFGGIGKASREKIGQALAAVGLTGFENRAIGTLSGGQLQRMLFARVLLQDARHGSGARQFPANPAVGARAGGLGYDLRSAHGRKPARRAADVRGVRRQRGTLRRRRYAVASGLIAT